MKKQLNKDELSSEDEYVNPTILKKLLSKSPHKRHKQISKKQEERKDRNDLETNRQQLADHKYQPGNIEYDCNVEQLDVVEFDEPAPNNIGQEEQLEVELNKKSGGPKGILLTREIHIFLISNLNWFCDNSFFLALYGRGGRI